MRGTGPDGAPGAASCPRVPRPALRGARAAEGPVDTGASLCTPGTGTALGDRAPAWACLRVGGGRPRVSSHGLPMRRLRCCLAAIALLLAPGAAPADDTTPLTLCLAPAADDSPCYPLKAVPATHRELLAVFRLRPGESFGKITHVWTAVDVGDEAPPGTEIARADLPLQGRTAGNLKFTLPRDLPVGKYRLDVSADGKPWASLEFPVVAASEATPLAKPTDLMPLEPGTSWRCSWVLETGPAVKSLTVAGAEKGADGKYRATTTFSVVGKEDGLARIGMQRGGQLVSEEWWSLTDAGLAVTKAKVGDTTSPFDPPLPMIPLPLKSPHRWTHQPKDAPPMEYRMWGPLPVQTPSGEKPGWIVWMRTTDGRRTSTVERHCVPGVGIVREVHTDAAGPALLTRIESVLLPAK